jgi:hypothetical protein
MDWIQPNGPNTKPQAEQTHDLLSSTHRDLTWRGMPLLCHDLDDENPNWTCAYCGKVNPDGMLVCGQDEWDGCGAHRPVEEEPPRGVLQLRKDGWEHAQSPNPPSSPVDFYADFPEPTMRAVFHPGRAFEDFKLELGRRILAAYQKTIKEVLSLC